MTALDFARWQGAVAGLLVGALAGALMEEAGLAGDATAAVVLAVIGGLLGHRAGERLHRRRLRRRAEALAGRAEGAADGGGTRAGFGEGETASLAPGESPREPRGGAGDGRAAGSAATAASAESLEAVLADFNGLRDDAAPSHGRIVAAVVERAQALAAVFDHLDRDRRLILEPGVSAPVDDALAAAVAARFEAFCDRAALDGVAAGEEMADYVAAAVDRKVVDLDPFRGRFGPDGASDRSEDASARGSARPERLHGGGLDTAVLRTLLILLVQVEQLRRTADRTTRDPRALEALAALKCSATDGTATLLGRPSPWYVQRWFPSVAADKY